MRRRLRPASLIAAYLGGVLAASTAGGETASLRSIGAGARFDSWTIERAEETTTLSQWLVPLEARVDMATRASLFGGIEIRGADLDAADNASAADPAGGWVELEARPAPGWLLAMGGSFPMRSNSLDLEEARLVSWLEETGLQLPASGVAFAPAMEIRAAREIRVGGEGKAAIAGAWIHRASYILFEDEATFNPGSRYRIAGAYGTILEGGRLQATAAYTREGLSQLEEESRFREGDRLRIGLRWVRPGAAEWDLRLGGLLQADGEGSDGWEAPAGGTVFSGRTSIAGGEDWRWIAALEAWRSGGFDDLLGDLVAFRPEAGIERRSGDHGFTLTAAPAFGFGEDELTLRGFGIRAGWEMRR